MEITANLLQPMAGGTQPAVIGAGEGASAGQTTDGLFALFFSQMVSAGGNQQQSAGALLSSLQTTTAEESDAPANQQGETDQSSSPAIPMLPAELLAMAAAPLMQQAPVTSPRQTVQPVPDHDTAHDATAAVAPLPDGTVTAPLPPQLPIAEQATADVPVRTRQPEFPIPQAVAATQHAEGKVSPVPTSSSQTLSATPAQPVTATPAQPVTAAPAQPVTATPAQPVTATPTVSLMANADNPVTGSLSAAPAPAVAVPAMQVPASAQPVKPMPQPVLTPDAAVVVDQQQATATTVIPTQPQAVDAQTPAPAKSRPGLYPVPPPARTAGPVRAEMQQTGSERGEVTAASVETGAVPVEVMVQDAASQEGAAFGDQGSPQHSGGRGNEASPSAMHVSADAVKGAEQHRYQSLEKTENGSVADHDQIISQVKEKLANHDVRGGDRISMTLHPEELGELKIMLHMNEQRLKVEIVAQNQTVREALMQNLDGLRDTLSRQNITVDRFDVNTGGGFNEAFREGRQTAQDRHYQQHPKFGFSATQAESERQTTASQWQPREDSLVDVHF